MWDSAQWISKCGCSFSTTAKYPGTFKDNPDLCDQRYSTAYGIYSPHCGLDNVMLSWGHDEYMVVPL
jgi:inositol oxygenase